MVSKDYHDPKDRTTGNAKLTADTVRFLREQYRLGQVSVRGICATYAMSGEGVRRMLRGETWAWVGEAERPPISDAEVNAAQEKLIAAMREMKATEAAGEAIVEELGGPAMSEGARALLSRIRGDAV